MAKERNNRNKNREKAISPCDLKKLVLKEQDIEKMYEQYGRFSRFSGHKGFDKLRKEPSKQ
jgi:hypothetical protein